MCAASKSQFKKHQLTSLSHSDIEKTHSDLGLGPLAKASSVKSLSDVYIKEEGSPDIWNQTEWASAYLQYFLSLNTMRLEHIGNLAKDIGFFEGLSEVIEFGSGPGTAQIALKNIFEGPWKCIETSEVAQKIH